jgi:hypothetical protein
MPPKAKPAPTIVRWFKKDNWGVLYWSDSPVPPQ